MITSLSWIPRGVARQRPVRYELTPEEMQRVFALAQQEKGELNSDAAAMHRSDVAVEMEDVDMSDLPPELNMEDYDNEDDVGIMKNDDVEDDMFDYQEQGGNLMLGDDESDEEDAEDNEVRPTDALIAVAITEDECSHLEVQLLSENGNLYVHHDIALPDFPLCLAWTDCPPYLAGDNSQVNIGNFIAVGTFNPVIEIWNLDVLDPLEPSATLGGKVVGKKHKKTGEQVYTKDTHQDSVMGLSWNKHFRQAMASCSADTTVKIWDITTQLCSHTFTHHTGKVQSVIWNDETPSLLASGSYDKTLALVDCRSGTVSPSIARLSADVESMAWDPFQAYHLYVSMENGEVACVDIRMNDENGKKAGVSGIQRIFSAHAETTTAISFSPQVRGLCATCSIDKTVKIWDTEPISQGNEPVLVAYKSMRVGQLFTSHFFIDEPFMLAAGGDAGMLAIWDCDEQDGIRNYFENRVENKPSDYIGLTTQQYDVENEAPMEEVYVDVNGMQTGFGNKDANSQVEPVYSERLLKSDLGGNVSASSITSSVTKKKKKKKKVKKTNH